MGKTNNNPVHLKNRVLLSTYIFRSLPMQFFKAVATDPKEQEEIRSTVKMLIRDKLIFKKTAIHKLQFIYLSKSGHTYITKSLLNEGSGYYSYRTDRNLRGSVGEHSFMNFAFIWNWIKQNPDLLAKNIQIFEDSDLNNCRFKFAFGGKDLVISPDVLIYLPDEANTAFKKAIFIENDTGGETYSKVYQKLIEYSLLVSRGLKQNLISSAEIYFIFHSQKRVEKLLSDKGLVSLFNYYNSSPKAKDVSVDIILKAFDGQNLPLYFSVLNQGIAPQPVIFKDLLLQRRPEWKHLV
jgi:hypothetical protein